MLRYTFTAISLVVSTVSTLSADDIVLHVDQTPAHGVVMRHVDLTAAAAWCGVEPKDVATLRATIGDDEQPLAIQFIHDAGAEDRLTGTIVLQLPDGFRGPVTLRPVAGPRASPQPFSGKVANAFYAIEHDPHHMGGLPSCIEFPDGGKRFDSFRWQDRLHHAERGGYPLRTDRDARVEKVADGPVCTVVRVRARYVQGENAQPASEPAAVYDWHYFRSLPLVYVTAAVTQREAFAWNELHFLELNFPDDAFARFAGGEPVARGEFAGADKTTSATDWGALLDGRNAIAMFDCGSVLVHDGQGYGRYLHARGGAAWTKWDTPRRDFSAWLWIGSDADPVAAVQALRRQLPTGGHARIGVASVESKLAAAHTQAAAQPPARRGALQWTAALAERLAARGRFAEAIATLDGQTPTTLRTLDAGPLRAVFEQTDGAVRLLSLFDLATATELLVDRVQPLAEITLQHAGSGEQVRLDTQQGWGRAAVEPCDGGLRFVWDTPRDDRLARITLTAEARADADAGAIRWSLAVDNPSTEWSVWRVKFPQLALAKPGPDAALLFPRGPGEVQRRAWDTAFKWHGQYPGGWTCMQLMAAYDATRRTGLYFAIHDPLASTKDIDAASQPTEQTVALAFDHPVADMGRAGNRFELSGQAVWQVLRGDWFDAAQIYRAWVVREAAWYPKLTEQGRADTPLWMRELPVWALSGGAPAGCVEQVERFAEYLDVPVGFHWYNWHEIPFDNDYPHYFPTKPGFAEAVARLQAGGVHVMPYINGRLWDTRDRGVDDFQFTQRALPAATKQADGQPHTETYGSKESDGSPVRLAAMCPTTELWQRKVAETVERLYRECGVHGVYIDQVAAARPVLCFDAAHGHPLGGGHWWTHGYWDLMDAVHRVKPADRMLTTECNAEPYVHRFDGYLTWHWQHDGQVPVFPAIYGGAIQMFGRAYRGGPTKDLALRMKAAQQLCFGEQIGWLHPTVVDEPGNAEFLRRVVQLRWRLRRYFYAGRMARPPTLVNEPPRVQADWQWSGHWPVETPAILTGAWQLPQPRRMVVLLANVSDQPIPTRLAWDARAYGFANEPIVEAVVVAPASDAQSDQPAMTDELTVPPQTVWAWEVSSAAAPNVQSGM